MTKQPSPYKPKARYPKRKTAGRTAAADSSSLDFEINLLRLAIEGMSERIDKEGNLPEQLRLMEGLSKAVARLGALLKTQRWLGQGNDEPLGDLSRILAEVNEKLRREGVSKS